MGFLETIQNVLGKVFNDVLAPILSEVLKSMFALITESIKDAFSELLLDILTLLLKIVHYLVKMFDIFSGSTKVIYYKAGDETTKGTLLEYFFQIDGIGRVFTMLTIIGGILAFLFAIYETGKTISDSVLEESKPISKVLGNGLKSMFSFMLIPLLCVFLLQFSNVVLQQINSTFLKTQNKIYEVDDNLGIDDILFNSIIIDAIPSGLSENEIKEIKNKYLKTARLYEDKKVVKSDLDITKIDYFTGYISILLMILILSGACIAFIRRCFELLLLYLISPAFSATIVLDGGSRFSKWRDKFVGKFFTAFGSVFSMRLFLMISPFFSSGMIKYTQDEYMNVFMHIMIILGGAWSVYKGQSVVTQLLFGQTT